MMAMRRGEGAWDGDCGRLRGCCSGEAVALVRWERNVKTEVASVNRIMR
jgi:hypothetical protein